jgi:hypothetical protein
MMEIVLPAPASANVPAFLAKLWKLVDDPDTNSMIGWSIEGTSFLILHQVGLIGQSPAGLTFGSRSGSVFCLNFGFWLGSRSVSRFKKINRYFLLFF